MEGRRPTAAPPRPRHDDDRHRYDEKHYNKKQRKPLLEDLLDF
ncbi:MAG TPA: hypothetical protein VNT03_18070 [Baekduia sp.]|nr:hypothetical protein [Baekduia sp.]